MTEELDSQLAIIQSGRWHEAVFTTYALSLTFFESCLLPALRHARCEKATIFVDIDGYRTSLMERRSASAGREYLVVPVEVERGIFHPKCTYLYGDDHDVLLVGSGNLTFGGHGKNVEVLETLGSDAMPACFNQFAEFVTQLLSRPDVVIPDRATLERLAQRARQTGRRTASEPGSVELVHTVQRPIADQVRERLSSLGTVKQVLVLSPYHHPAAEPVRRLMGDTGAKELLVGVPSDGSPTSFPLSSTNGWDARVRCVRPNVESKKRGLHAKWWELRGDKGTLTLTGSVNATLESFTTTNNIEVAVLRKLQKPLHDVWEATEAPDFEKSDFRRGDASGVGAVYAAVDGEGRVRGRILGLEDPEGEWLVHIDEVSVQLRKVEADETGTFAWRDTNLLMASQTLQVELRRGDDIARGWLSNEAVLRMPSRSRAVAQAVVRMLMREETADDVDAMFDYIATETAAAIAEAPQHAPQQAAPKRSLPEDDKITVKDFEFAGSSTEERLLRSLASGSPTAAHRLSILDSIAAVLLGRKSGQYDPKRPGSGRPAQRSGEEDEEESTVQIARDQALERFNAVMKINLAQTDISGRPLGIAMRIWLYVNLDMQVRRIAAIDAAWLFAAQWVARVLKAPLDDEARDLLAEAFCGVSGGLLARRLDRSHETVIKNDLQLTARTVHDWLDRFFGHRLDKESVAKYAAEWAEHDIAGLMLVETRTSPADALNIALAAPTAKQLLAEVVKAHADGSWVNVPGGVFSPEAGKLIDRVQRSSKDRPAYRVVYNGLPGGCPKCYVKLITDTRAHLRVNRIAECLNCHSVLVWLGMGNEAR